MSYQTVDKVLDARLPLKPSERLVLVYFAKHANKRGITYPSLTRIGDIGGITRRETMAAIIKRLVYLNLISPTGRRHGTTQQVIEYQINIDHIQEMSGKITLPDGANTSLFSEFMEYRGYESCKSWHFIVNETSKEAAKAGISFDEAIRFCLDVGIRLFKADIYFDSK